MKAAHTTIARLEGEVVGLVTLGDNLHAQMAGRKARLGTNSSNSSKARGNGADARASRLPRHRLRAIGAMMSTPTPIHDRLLDVGNAPAVPLFAMLPPEAPREVVILHEIFGRQPEIDRVVERFADAGYAAVAPDLFYGHGVMACLSRSMETIQTGQGPFVDTIRSARGWLCERTGLPEGAVGLIGFCLSGGFALASGRGWAAVSTNYGHIPTTEVMRGIGPVIACYGARDVLNRTKGNLLRERLAPLGIEPEVHVYPDVGHAFLTDGHHPIVATLLEPLLHVAWNPEVADEAWGMILAFFDGNLRGA